ncbi:hypothetical protein L6R46_31715 [Myxococcota bacterium]|nr:hypothetical protein [Myxococcota bacterium]
MRHRRSLAELRRFAPDWPVRVLPSAPASPDDELRAGVASLKWSSWCVNPTPIPPSFEETYALP